MTQTLCWINEPYSFSHEVYRQLAQRSKVILFDWNPKQNHWIEKEKLKESTYINYSTFLDNPFLSTESRNQLLSYQPIKYSEVVQKKLITEPNAKDYDFELNQLEFIEELIAQGINLANYFNGILYGAKSVSASFGFSQNLRQPGTSKTAIVYDQSLLTFDGISTDGVNYKKPQNTKSEVIVSLLFNEKLLVSEPVVNPILPDDVENRRIGLLTFVFDVLNVFKAIPPLTNGKSKAGAFNIIVPISGKNKPYDPDIVIPLLTAPKALLAVDTDVPLLPDTIWNTRPASQ